MPFATFPVREQVLTAAPASLQSGDDLGAQRILDRLPAADALLGDVVEDEPPVRGRDVGLGDRREAEVAVLALVDLAPDPEQADIQEPHGAREHAGAVELCT